MELIITNDDVIKAATLKWECDEKQAQEQLDKNRDEMFPSPEQMIQILIDNGISPERAKNMGYRG